MLPQSRDSERGLRPTGLLVKGAPHRGPRERSGVLEGSGARGSTWALSRLSATPWAAALPAPLSVGFSRQELWSGQLFPSPGGSS